MSSPKSVLCSLVLCSTAFAPNALAQSATEKTTTNGPAERFGGKGQIAISSEVGLTVQSSSTSGVDASTTTVQLEPAVDYFVVPNLSLGGFVSLNYTKQGDNHQTRFGIGPRVGYNVALSDLVSIWPKAGLSFGSTSATQAVTVAGAGTGNATVTSSTTTSATNVALNLFVPLMFHPAAHFFAGFGPFLDTDLSGDAKTTTFGGKLTIGGWI